MTELKVLSDIEDIPIDRLFAFIKAKAEGIVRVTQGESWDHPSAVLVKGVDLGHACYRLIRELEKHGMRIEE